MHVLAMVEPHVRSCLQEFGVYRYNIMTTNIFECLNVVLVKGHKLHVITLAKEMRSIIQRWHYKCRSITEKCKTKMTVEAEKTLAEQYQLSLRMRLDPAFDTYYMVFDNDKNGIVDLEAHTCSCRRFQLDQLLCAHAIIAIRHLRGDVYEYCFEYYSMEN
ncbi:hypothetical protein UlMin_002518 [Ulmus minor]